MTTSSIPSSPIEALEAKRLAQAKDQGFALFCINADENQPAFIYSVGMAQRGFPELLCFAAPGMESATAGFIHYICTMIVQGLERFSKDALLQSFLTRSITATDPEVTYTPTMLGMDEGLYAYNCFLTRANRFKKELGISGVIEMKHSDVPSLAQVRAQLMFAAS